MKIIISTLLFIWGVHWFLEGADTYSWVMNNDTTIMHQMSYMICFLISTISFIGAWIGARIK